MGMDEDAKARVLANKLRDALGVWRRMPSVKFNPLAAAHLAFVGGEAADELERLSAELLRERKQLDDVLQLVGSVPRPPAAMKASTGRGQWEASQAAAQQAPAPTESPALDSGNRRQTLTDWCETHGLATPGSEEGKSGGGKIGPLRLWAFQDSAFSYDASAERKPWRYTEPDWPAPPNDDGIRAEVDRLVDAARKVREDRVSAAQAVQGLPKGGVREAIESTLATWKAKGITPRMSEDSQVPPGFLEAAQPGESPAEFSARCAKFGVVAVHCSATHDGAVRMIAIGPWDMPKRDTGTPTKAQPERGQHVDVDVGITRASLRAKSAELLAERKAVERLAQAEREDEARHKELTRTNDEIAAARRLAAAPVSASAAPAWSRAPREVPGPGDRFTSPAELLRIGKRPLVAADEGARMGWGTYEEG